VTLRIGSLLEVYLSGHFSRIRQAQTSKRITPTPQWDFLYPTQEN
jgi:hypothetical protein